jgi:hypothetical protein
LYLRQLVPRLVLSSVLGVSVSVPRGNEGSTNAVILVTKQTKKLRKTVDNAALILAIQVADETDPKTKKEV